MQRNTLDTNILVRCLTLDALGPVPAAKTLLSHANGVFVAKTVLLELEWVLRAAYKLPRPVIHSALVKLLGLANLTVESPGQASQTLLAYSQGLDFADALPLFAAATDEGFSLSMRTLRAPRPPRGTPCIWPRPINLPALVDHEANDQ